jgi:hypothetical protein
MAVIEDWSTSHLAPLQPGEGSFGPTSGFSENFFAASERQYRVDSMFGLQAEMSDRFRTTLDAAKAASGEQFDVDEAALIPWIRQKKGEAPFSTFDPWRPFQDKQRLLDQMNTFNARLQQMKAEGKPVQTLDDILQDTVKSRAAITGEADKAWRTAGLGGMAGGILGSMWGSLSFERDPVLVGSFFLPGYGRAVATRLMSEFAMNAGAEAVQQFSGIRPTRELLDEEQRNPWGDILIAGALGAGVRGAVEVAPSAFRSVERMIAPDRANARVFRDTMEQVLQEDFPIRTPTEAELLRGLELLPQTPKVRAAREVLLAEMEAIQAQGYRPPLARRAEAQLSAQEIADAIAVAEGRKTSTAVNRFLPEVADEQGRVPASIEAMAREVQPALYRDLEEARARVTEVDTQIQAAEAARTSRRLADTFNRVAPDLEERVRLIEEELDGAIPRKRRQALEKELDGLVEAVGPETLVRAEADAGIGPKKEARRLQKQRALRQKEYNRLKKEADAVELKVLEDMRARAKIAQMMQGGRDFRGETRRLDAAERDRPALTEGIKRRVLEPAPSETGGASPKPASPTIPEKIDLGDDTLVESSFRFIDDETGTAMTVAEAFKDMADDDAMLAAMRSCAL